MKNKMYKKTDKHVYVVMGFLIAIYAMSSTVNYVSGAVESEPSRLAQIFRVIVFIICTFAIFKKKKNIKFSLRSFPFYLLLFIFLIMFNIAISDDFIINKLIFAYRYLYWVAIFFYFYLFGSMGKIRQKDLQVAMFLFSIVILVHFALQFSFRGTRGDLLALNTSYDLLWSLPLLLLGVGSGAIVRTFICLSSIICILISFKRGAIIALFASLGVWEFYRKKLYKTLRTSNYLIKPIGLIVAFLSCLLVFLSYESVFLARFLETGGSGRSDFYTLIFEGWQQSSNINKVFGFGYNSVPELLEKTYGVAIYAHSDVLTVLYDYGLFGVTSYILLFFGLYVGIKKGVGTKSFIVLPLAASSTIFFLAGLYSGSFMFPQTMVFVSIIFGYCLGTIEAESVNL